MKLLELIAELQKRWHTEILFLLQINKQMVFLQHRMTILHLFVVNFDCPEENEDKKGLAIFSILETNIKHLSS